MNVIGPMIIRVESQGQDEGQGQDQGQGQGQGHWGGVEPLR